MNAEQTADELLDDAITAVSKHLTTISNLIPLINALTTSRQRGLGFVTWEGKQIQDQMIRSDRDDAVERLDKVRRSGLMHLVEPAKAGRGASHAPGNIVAVSVEAHVHTTLHHVIRQLVRDQASRGVCTLIRVPLDADLRAVIVAVRSLSWSAGSLTLLRSIGRDLEQLLDDAHRLIDGNDRTILGADCPHCGNRTLVVYFKDDLIRCDRHPKTGRYEDCTCADPLCDCKTRPEAFRHEWHRNKGTKPNGWWALADRLNLVREIS